MPLVSRILGWSPPDDKDFVDVPVTYNSMFPLQNPTFHISEPNPIRRLRRVPSGDFETASPPSSTSEHSSDELPIDERVDNTGKHGDPAWVARPRNEFILFRCDYVRKHSREGKRIRRAPGAEAVKTLSKQAAEAWHHLPPEERLYWKERANGERNEHARRYPDYRYRPKKNASGRRRQARCPPSKPVGTVEEVTASTTPNASQLDLHKSALILSPQTSTGMSSLGRGTPRRYSSVPHLSITEPIHRRLRSTASYGWIGLPAQSSSSSSSDRLDLAPSSREYTPMPRIPDGSSFESSDYLSPESTSSTATTEPSGTTLQSSSSLLNWNGAGMVPSAPQPAQFLSESSTSVSLCTLPALDISSTHLLADYTTGGNPEPVPSSQAFELGGMHYHIQGDIWMSQMQSYTGDHDATVVAADGVGPKSLDSNATQDHGNSFAACAPAKNAMYGSSEPTLIPITVDYSIGPIESIPVDLLRAGARSNPEILFAMDTDQFFDPTY
ncbi:hypothetical protein BDZ97DRAFT_1755316 [Flammula alnicola]|nr:hypothetical protein BDZ97DRAFT_1755316 [Flammula alnicola]